MDCGFFYSYKSDALAISRFKKSTVPALVETEFAERIKPTEVDPFISKLQEIHPYGLI